MVNDNLVLLAGDYDARLASRNMELVDLETLESTEITVRDYHPGPRFPPEKIAVHLISNRLIYFLYKEKVRFSLIRIEDESEYFHDLT